FYRRDSDGQLEFTGENEIDHTPTDETLRFYTGNAFDAVGQRRRVSYKIDHDAHWIDETFEIKLRNHKKEPLEVRVVEHILRTTNSEIDTRRHRFDTLDSKMVEIRVLLAADAEKTLDYLVHYT